MSKEYKTYSEAVKNRKQDEITVYNSLKKVYKNLKVFPRFNRRIFFLW